VPGESIALNGCCLTVAEIDGDALHFQAGPETLARTNLGELTEGTLVNLERALPVGARLGGHLVSGHIDGVGHVRDRQDDREWSTFWFIAPPPLLRQMASKGSIAVDGVSLTLVEVTDECFSVQLIPHTLAVTTLGHKQPGDRVNLETDLLAKYVERQLAFRTA
jgi:riboflavin synthase